MTNIDLYLLILIIFSGLLVKSIRCKRNELSDSTKNVNFSTSRNLIGNEEEEKKYLVYQPQFGICNQLRALHHAIAISKVLHRTLVIPDIIDNDGLGPIYKRDILFDSSLLVRSLTGVLKHDNTKISCITMDTFKKLLTDEKAYLPSKILDIKLTFKQLAPNNLYFDNLGWKFPLVVANSLDGYKEQNWKIWNELNKEKMRNEDTLAISTTFGGWMGASNKDDRMWHSAVEELVYQESKWIADFVNKLVDFHPKIKDGFMCAHVRRGNFKKACERYDQEFHSNASRPWVKSFSESGLACWVDEHMFVDEVDEVTRIAKERYKRDLPILLITNDNKFVDVIRATDPGYNVYTIDQIADLGGIFIPALPVIEMTLCSKAKVLIANQYSTFSRAIYKKAVWKRKQMTKFSFAWSKSIKNITYYADSWVAAGPYVNHEYFL